MTDKTRPLGITDVVLRDAHQSLFATRMRLDDMLPIAENMGHDPLWFVVMNAVILQTSFLTPPFGYALFYLKGVAPPEVQTLDLYKAVIPFCALIVLACGLMALFPSLILGLPNALLGR